MSGRAEDPAVSRHAACVSWRLEGSFANGRYSRRHQVRLGGGAAFEGSASPEVVPLPWSDPALADPEELFVASLAACHMLWFLHRAREAGLEVLAYDDEAEGELAPAPDGGLVMSRVRLRPRARLSGPGADARTLEDLHRQAHAACFLARAVRCPVTVEPRA